MNCPDCNHCGRQVAWIGVWVNLILAFVDFLAGFASGSKGLIADGMHSAACIITAFIVLISREMIKRDVSRNYHFGFGKAEFLTAAFSNLLIIVMAVFLVISSIKHLVYHGPSTVPGWMAVMVAIVSIGANEMLFRYMRCVGTKLKSQTILANAWANRAGCFLSITVLIGIIGAKSGVPHLDPIAAMIVVVAIIKISSTMLIDALKFLMDVSVNDLYSDEISSLVGDIDGVRAMENLKTRQIGHYVWVELDVLVDPLLSLKNAGCIGELVKKTLLDKISAFERITVHTRPMPVQEDLP